MPSKQRPRVRKGKARPAAGSYDAWHGTLPPRDQRVEDIVGKMMSGAWLSGVSDRTLAREWNLDPSTVRSMASEASRMVRMLIKLDPQAQAEARAQLLQLFEVIRAKAMAKGDPASLRVALDALRAYGFYLGIEPAKQLSIATHDPFEGWSTDEKQAFARDGSRPRRAANGIALAVAHGIPRPELRDDGLNGHPTGAGDPDDTN